MYILCICTFFAYVHVFVHVYICMFKSVHLSEWCCGYPKYSWIFHIQRGPWHRGARWGSTALPRENPRHWRLPPGGPEPFGPLTCEKPWENMGQHHINMGQTWENHGKIMEIHWTKHKQFWACSGLILPCDRRKMELPVLPSNMVQYGQWIRGVWIILNTYGIVKQPPYLISWKQWPVKVDENSELRKGIPERSMIIPEKLGSFNHQPTQGFQTLLTCPDILELVEVIPKKNVLGEKTNPKVLGVILFRLSEQTPWKSMGFPRRIVTNGGNSTTVYWFSDI